jgi:SulP family sulfate permease
MRRLAIAFLGLLEAMAMAMAMAKSIASKTGEKLDMNQQCLSEGLANTVGSFFNCFPGSGSLTRTFINHSSGAATQWSGVISAAGVAATIMLFAPFASYIPRPALAAILVLTAFRMTELATLKYIAKATRFDALILAITALSAILVSVEFCILIGVALWTDRDAQRCRC